MVKQIDISVVFIRDQWLNRGCLNKEPTTAESSPNGSTIIHFSLGFTYIGDEIFPDAL